MAVRPPAGGHDSTTRLACPDVSARDPGLRSHSNVVLRTHAVTTRRGVDMQDLGDDPRLGRRRLSSVQGERGTPTVTEKDQPVVPAQRLLKVAAALSDGATRLHQQ